MYADDDQFGSEGLVGKGTDVPIVTGEVSDTPASVWENEERDPDAQAAYQSYALEGGDGEEAKQVAEVVASTDQFVEAHTDQSMIAEGTTAARTTDGFAETPAPVSPQRQAPAEAAYSGEKNTLDASVAGLSTGTGHRQVFVTLGDPEIYRRHVAELAAAGKLTGRGTTASGNALSDNLNRVTRGYNEERQIAAKHEANGGEQQATPLMQHVSVMELSFARDGALARMLGMKANSLRVEAVGTAESLQKDLAESKALALTLANHGVFGKSDEVINRVKADINQHFDAVSSYIQNKEAGTLDKGVAAPRPLNLRGDTSFNTAMAIASEKYAAWSREQVEARNAKRNGKEQSGDTQTHAAGEQVSAVMGEKEPPPFAKGLMSDLAEVRANPELLKTSERLGAVPLMKSVRKLNDATLAELTPDQRNGILAQAQALLDAAKKGELGSGAKKELSFTPKNAASFEDKVMQWVDAEKAKDANFEAQHLARVAALNPAAATTKNELPGGRVEPTLGKLDQAPAQAAVLASDPVPAPAPAPSPEGAVTRDADTVRLVDAKPAQESITAPTEGKAKVSGLQPLQVNLSVGAERGFQDLPKSDMETLLNQVDGVRHKPLAQLAGKDPAQQEAFVQKVSELLAAGRHPSQDPEIRDHAGSLRAVAQKWEADLVRATPGREVGSEAATKPTSALGDGVLGVTKEAPPATTKGAELAALREADQVRATTVEAQSAEAGPARYASAAENPAFQTLKQLSHAFENPAASMTKGHLTREPRMQWDEPAVQKTLTAISNLKAEDVAQLKAKDAAALAAYANWANKHVKAGTLPGVEKESNRDLVQRLDTVAKSLDGYRGATPPSGIGRGLGRADALVTRMTMRTRNVSASKGLTQGTGPSTGLATEKPQVTPSQKDMEGIRLASDLVTAVKQLDSLDSSYGKYLVLESQKLDSATLNKLDGPTKADTIVAMDVLARYANKGGLGDLNDKLQQAATKLQDRADQEHKTGDVVDLINAHNRYIEQRESQSKEMAPEKMTEREGPGKGDSHKGMDLDSDMPGKRAGGGSRIKGGSSMERDR